MWIKPDGSGWRGCRPLSQSSRTAVGPAAFLGFTADGRRAAVILTNNTAAYPDDLGFATLDEDAPLAPTYNAMDLPSASLDDYVGTYKLADKFLLKIFRRDEGLFAQATGQGAFPIFPSARDEPRNQTCTCRRNRRAR